MTNPIFTRLCTCTILNCGYSETAQFQRKNLTVSRQTGLALCTGPKPEWHFALTQSEQNAAAEFAKSLVRSVV